MFINKPPMWGSYKKKAKCSSAASRKIFPQKLGSVYVVYETLLSPLLQCSVSFINVEEELFLKQKPFLRKVSYSLTKVRPLG